MNKPVSGVEMSVVVVVLSVGSTGVKLPGSTMFILILVVVVAIVI